MNLREQLAALMESAEQFKGRTDLSEEEAAEAMNLANQIEDLSGKVKAADAATAKLDGLYEGVKTAKTDTDPDYMEAATIGERFVKSDAMRKHRELYPRGIGDNTSAVKGMKVLVGRKDDEPASVPTVISRPVAGLPFETTDRGIVNPFEHQRRLTVLDLITKGTTNADSLKYRALTAIHPGAAIVPESLDDTDEKYLKPLTTIELAPFTATDTTYADGAVVTTQEWRDDGALTTLINSVLVRNLELEVEDMVLNGTGQNDEPVGILNADGINTQAFDTDILTTIRKARGQLDALGYAASALVVSPADATKIDLLQAQNGSFYGGGPVAAGGTPSLWGVPIVVSPKVAEGTALLGDWATIHLLTIDPVNINLFDQHADYARRNLLYLRAEFRGLQLLRAPASFVVVTLAGN